MTSLAIIFRLCSVQMDQKHAIEDMFAGELPLTSLQATLFMEELWKKYTRPGSE